MIFPTKVAGIPCQCKVTHATPIIPMNVYGPGMADADPAEGGEFEYVLLDRRNYPARWLEKKVTPQDEARLFEEFAILTEAEAYDDY